MDWVTAGHPLARVTGRFLPSGSNSCCTIWPAGPPGQRVFQQPPQRQRGGRAWAPRPTQGFHQLLSPGATCLLFPCGPSRNLMPGCWPTRQSTHSRTWAACQPPTRGPHPRNPSPEPEPRSPGGPRAGTVGPGGLPRHDLPQSRGPGARDWARLGSTALTFGLTSVASHVLALKTKLSTAGTLLSAVWLRGQTVKGCPGVC